MNIATAHAFATIAVEDLTPAYIIPGPFDQGVASAVGAAVMQAASSIDL
jgi:malic enzyme